MYIISKFRDYTFPTAVTSDRVGSMGRVKAPVYPLAQGGALDTLGFDKIAVLSGGTITKDFRLATGTEASDITALESIHALRGKVGQLWRLWDDDSTQFVIARCLEVSFNRKAVNYRFVDVSLTFIVYSEYWLGTRVGDYTFDSGQSFDDGLIFDSSDGQEKTLTAGANVITVEYAGNATAKDVIFQFTAGSADITQIEITASSYDITIDATVSAGETLTVFFGRWLILDHSGDDITSALSLGTGHTREELLYLEPGDNDFTITLTGGSTDSEVVISYWESWA